MSFAWLQCWTSDYPGRPTIRVCALSSMENALPLALYHNTTWTVGFWVGMRADIYRIGMSRVWYSL
jgi:hypothetical protein